LEFQRRDIRLQFILIIGVQSELWHGFSQLRQENLLVRVLASAPEIEAFIRENDAKLKTKE
jgi:hypothetical protein